MAKLLNAIGLMSGTSMDGIDVAHVITDGEKLVEQGESRFFAYDDEMRKILRTAMRDATKLKDRDARPAGLQKAEAEITAKHIDAVQGFLSATGLSATDIDLIGFHGQTVLHRPQDALTVQLGDGAALATATGIKVVGDMRANDMKNSGQGAPMAPAYHAALATQFDHPVCFVNIGGIANVSWVDVDGSIIAFDCGPGNALLDDWALKHTGKAIDENGALAGSGTVDEDILHDMLRHPFFTKSLPKSLDRGDFTIAPMADLSAEDGAATLTDFTARAVINTAEWFPHAPGLWVICGGGRHNVEIMKRLAFHAECAVAPTEALGLDGDAIEAQAWGYLAVRAVKSLPLTWPTTTGVLQPVSGGVIFDN